MKKLFKSLIPIVGMVIFVLTIIFPEPGHAAGVTSAAMFITTSITWGGKENYDYFLRPMFIGKSPWETQGIRVIPNVQSSQKLNYFGTAGKILKAYVKGFNPANGTTYTQRILTTVRLKAEAADDASEFYQTVFESGLRKDDWNNLDGTILKEIVITLYRNALASDIFRIFWCADPYKELVTAGFQNGTADPDYNQLTGMWTLIFQNASLTPNDLQIQRIASSDAAVAQVQTLTLTGTTGTCNVNFEGKTYVATFATSLAQTHANFVATYAPALLNRGIVLTGTTTAIFTSLYPGRPQAVATVGALTGDLGGAFVQTTANTAPTALSAGEAYTNLLALYEGCDIVLKNIPANEKIFLVDRLVYQNYITYLETLATVTANMKLENGVQIAMFRGIPVIPMEWSSYFSADFAKQSGQLPYYPNKIIYAQTGNLVLGIDAMSQFNETKMWYDTNTEENRFRSKLVMGVQYVHNKLMAVSY